MGGDGGTVAVCRRFFRGAKQQARKEKENEQDRSATQAKYCTISGKPLTEPVVCCKLGLLYNKEELLLKLLDKSLDESYRHIRKLKDTIECTLERNPASKEGSSRFICPITLIEMKGSQPFVVLTRTGQVISLKAAKELAANESYIELFPTPEELKQRRKQLKSVKEKRKREGEAEISAPKKKTKNSQLNCAFSNKAASVIEAAESKVSEAKGKSTTYAKLFAVNEEDSTKGGKDKDRLFMLGNPRGYVRC